MPYHPRIETTNVATFQTTRTIRSELWLVNCPKLEDAILGYAAKYTEQYEVQLYALALEGNHTQFPALFPKGNRAYFMRDFNSAIARAIPRYQSEHGGGKVWARRYSAEFLHANADVEEYFFYTVLQAVQDGLVDDIRKQPGYNCFEDAITGRERKFKVVKWKEYNDARRWRKNVDISEFTEIYTLKYTRLPGYEEMSQRDYQEMMRRKLREKTAAIVAQRQGKPFAGEEVLKKVKPGSKPRRTKTSTIRDHRPRNLTKDPESRKRCDAWYYTIYFAYKAASEAYRAGDLTVEFPEGTYKPPLFTVVMTARVL